MAKIIGKTKYFYLSIGFVVGVFFLTSCGGGGTAVSAIIGRAIEVIFDNTTSTLTSNNVQDAIEEVNTKADVNTNSISSLNTRVTTNEANISTNATNITSNATAINNINYRVRKYDFDSESTPKQVTPIGDDVATGMSIQVNARGRQFWITASINANNTVDQSTPHDTTIRFDLKVNGTVKRTETIVVKANTRQIVNIQWLENYPTTATISIDVIANANARIDLENRYLYVIEL